MNRERAFLLQILAALLVFSSPAWTQDFGTNVVGSATAAACHDTQKYSQSGQLDSSGQARSKCSPPLIGGAYASSQADLNLVTQGIAGFDRGSAKAAALTWDTVTLNPPQNFSGNSVTFTIKDIYAMAIEVQGGSGSVRMCWAAPRVLNNCIKLTHGKGGGTLETTVTLGKSPAGFQFQITKTMAADISGTVGSAGFATTGDPSFILPNGWTCTFASGVPCQ